MRDFLADPWTIAAGCFLGGVANWFLLCWIGPRWMGALSVAVATVCLVNAMMLGALVWGLLGLWLLLTPKESWPGPRPGFLNRGPKPKRKAVQ